MKKYIHITSGVLTLTPDVVYNVSNTSKQGGIFVKRWLCLCLVVCMMISLPSAMMEEANEGSENDTLIENMIPDNAEDISSESLDDMVREINGELGEEGFSGSYEHPIKQDEIGNNELKETDLSIPLEQEEHEITTSNEKTITIDSISDDITDANILLAAESKPPVSKRVMDETLLWPVPGTTNANISSHVDYRGYIGENATLYHHGMDIVAGEGTAIVAVASGTAKFMGTSKARGKWVVIDHGGGWYTDYQHLSNCVVDEGISWHVDKGDTIGQVGHTGNVVGNPGDHLHFEVTWTTNGAGLTDLYDRGTWGNESWENLGCRGWAIDGWEIVDPEVQRYVYSLQDIDGGSSSGGSSASNYNYPVSSYERCTYRIVQDFTWRKAASSSAEPNGKAKAGETFESEAIILNTDSNNMWLKKRGEDKYVFAGYKWNGSNWFLDNSQTQYLQFVSDNRNINWDSCNIPTTHQKGSSLALRGSLNADTRMISVTGEFYNGKSCWGNPTAAYPINGTNYPMYNSSLDNALKFGSLPESSNIVLVLTVKYRFNREQGTGTYTIEKPFAVIGSGSSGGNGSGGTPGGSTTGNTTTYEVITSQGLNVRSGAGTGYGVITTIWPGTTIAVTETATVGGVTWGHGTTSTGVNGWISLSGSLVRQVSVEPAKVALDVNGWLDGAVHGGLQSYGTVDVYINGQCVANDVDDYCSQWPVGSVYEIRDIKANPGYIYKGVYDGVLFGTLGNQQVNVVLSFDRDSANPVISNVRVSNVTSEGYTVTCNASDNLGVAQVKFPTWTEQNGQDDLIWHVGTLSGNTASFNVKVSDHKNERGCTYVTHIYAYDAAGNSTSTGVTVQVPAKAVEPDSVRINEGSDIYLDIGETKQLTVTVSPSNAANKAVTWKSEHPAIASVDANGRVTLLANGSAFIVATTWNGKSVRCTIKKSDKPKTIAPTGITLTPTAITIREGEVANVTATMTPANAVAARIWYSSDDSVAELEAAGRIRGVKAGTATITVKTDNEKTASCKVTVVAKNVAVTGISLNKTSTTIYVGETEKLNATVQPGNATNKAVTWNSSAVSVATVDANGRITAVKKGTAKITATTVNGQTETCTVKVTEAPKAKSVKLDRKGTVELAAGSTLSLTATVSPGDARTGLTWSSSNVKAATVNANGTVKGVNEGTATITVKTDNGKKATVKVKVIDPYAPKSIAFEEKSVTANVGEGYALRWTLMPSSARTTVNYKSSNTKTAIVSDSGVVTGLKEGTVTITATTGNGKKATVKVKLVDPYKPSGIAFKDKNAAVNVGETLTLGWALTPSTARTTVTFKSSSKKIATVDANGVVLGIKEGTATITAATANGKKAKIKIKVSDPYKATGIALGSKTATIGVGETLALNWTLTPSTARTTVKFKSSSAKVATVDANGLVKGLKKGTATITVTTANGKKATIKVKVG